MIEILAVFARIFQISLTIFGLMRLVPRMLDTFPLWAAMEIAWNKKYFALFSPVARAMRSPISSMNFFPLGPHEPRVSMAMGMIP